jgi:hypothetical protein
MRQEDHTQDIRTGDKRPIQDAQKDKNMDKDKNKILLMITLVIRQDTRRKKTDGRDPNQR